MIVSKTSKVWFFVVVSALSACGGRNESTLSDNTFKLGIVGKWREETRSSKGTTLIATQEKFPDGTFVQSGKILRSDGKEIDFDFEGEWNVQNGVVLNTVRKSNVAGIPVGFVTRDKLIRVNDKEFVYQTERGEVVTQNRLP